MKLDHILEILKWKENRLFHLLGKAQYYGWLRPEEKTEVALLRKEVGQLNKELMDATR